MAYDTNAIRRKLGEHIKFVVRFRNEILNITKPENPIKIFFDWILKCLELG